MYALVCNLETRAARLREATTFAGAFVLAELFYKFHSFSLECLAFLATWTLLSGVVDLGGRLLGRANDPGEDV